MDQLKGMVAHEQHKDFVRKLEHEEAIRILKAAQARPNLLQRMRGFFKRRPSAPPMTGLKSQKKY